MSATITNTDILNAINKTNELLTRIAAQSAPAAPNYNFQLSAYPSFDWVRIGATVVKTDTQGASTVSWNMYQWERRSKSGKFGDAIWFSRADGKDSQGNTNWIRLITFKDSADADTLDARIQLNTVPSAPQATTIAPQAGRPAQPANHLAAQAKPLASQANQPALKATPVAPQATPPAPPPPNQPPKMQSYEADAYSVLSELADPTVNDVLYAAVNAYRAKTPEAALTALNAAMVASSSTKRYQQNQPITAELATALFNWFLKQPSLVELAVPV